MIKTSGTKGHESNMHMSRGHKYHKIHILCANTGFHMAD